MVDGLQTIQAFEVKTAPSTSPTSPSSPITLSSGGPIDKEALLELQQVFLETFALPSFQRKLRETSTATGSDVSLWELLEESEVQRLEKYGMEASLLDFSEPDFQEAIEKLKQTADASSHLCRDQGYYQLPGRAAMAFAVQEQLLPCFGLPGSRQGVQQMIARCACFLEDEEVVQLMDSVNMKLGVTSTDPVFRKLGMSPSAAVRFRTLAMELK
eukprot:g31288.t1